MTTGTAFGCRLFDVRAGAAYTLPCVQASSIIAVTSVGCKQLALSDPCGQVLVWSLEVELCRTRVHRGGGVRWQNALALAQRQLATMKLQVQRSVTGTPRPRECRYSRTRSSSARSDDPPDGDPDLPGPSVASPYAAPCGPGWPGWGFPHPGGPEGLSGPYRASQGSSPGGSAR
jgi:hypothetical protein